LPEALTEVEKRSHFATRTGNTVSEVTAPKFNSSTPRRYTHSQDKGGKNKRDEEQLQADEPSQKKDSTTTSPPPNIQDFWEWRENLHQRNNADAGAWGSPASEVSDTLLRKKDLKRREKRRIALSRRRRQVFLLILLGVAIVAAASFLYGRSQVVDLAVNAGVSDQAVAVLADHETRLSICSRSVAILEDNAKRTQTTMHSIMLTEGLLRTMLVNGLFEKDARRIINALALLSNFRLHPDLVHPVGVEDGMKRLVVATAEKGLTLLDASPLRLYSYHTSFVSFANGYLRVMVHIPALRTGGMLSLVQFLPMPWMVQSGPKKEMGTYVMPSPEDSVLAIDDSKTVYKTMSLAALHDCTQTLGFFKCPQMSLADRRTQDSCLVGLYAADHEVVQRHCPLSLSPPADMLVQLNNSDFILFQPQNAYVEMRCPGKVSSEKVKGLWRI
jgi:hypothetical protein